MEYDIQKGFFLSLEKEIKKDRISHAYLIETNGFSRIDEFLNILIKLLLCPTKEKNLNCNKCNLCNLIDNNNYPDLKIINADGSWIKKEQLLDIKDAFRDKSVYDNKQIYIIKDASKLNASSGNTMLKFLEEPSPNIIAILLTNNRYNVLDTILSRCQVFSLENNEKIELDDDTKNLCLSLFQKNKGFLAFNDILLVIPDKKEAQKKLLIVEKYLFSIIKSKKIIEELNYLDNNQIYKLILIIEKYLGKMEFNLNYKLTLDNMIIDIKEVIL